MRRFVRIVAAVVVLVASVNGHAANLIVPAGDTAALVEAMTIADGNGEADTITLAAGSTYSFTTSVEGNLALPSVNTEMTIVGNGAILERAASSVEEMRILRLAFNANLTLQDVTIRGGRISGMGIAGAGILVSSGQLTLLRSTITDNHCDGGLGGGLYVASGPVTIQDSAITANRAQTGGGVSVFGPGNAIIERTAITDNVAEVSVALPAMGGGIAATNLGTVSLTDVTIRGNQAMGSGTQNGQGGGIGTEGGWTITRVTIADNHASASASADALGGGIYAFGNGPSFAIVNGTITGNSAAASGTGKSDGGGIYVKAVNSTSTLNNVTIASNGGPTGTRGGGIFLGNPGSIGADAYTLQNTIVGGNTAATGPDCFTESGKAFVSAGYNLLESTTACGFAAQPTDVQGQGPLLGVLADNGGLTQTMALRDGSPAVNTGSPTRPGSGGDACDAVDQRCFGRPAGSRCDIGAYEKDAVNVCAPTTTSTTGVSTTTTTTTLPGCGAAVATFVSIDCRLDALIARLEASTDLGKSKTALVKGATAVRGKTKQAEGLVASGKTKPAKKALKKAGRKMVGFVHRLASNKSRKTIPAATRESFIDEATPIRGDLQALQGTL